VLVAVVVGSRWRRSSPIRSRRSRSSRKAEQSETQLKEEYPRQEETAINLDLHRQQLREIDTQFGAAAAAAAEPLADGRAARRHQPGGLGRGLQSLVQAGASSRRESLRELPIQVKVVATTTTWARSRATWGQLSRIVTLNDVSIQAEGRHSHHGRVRGPSAIWRRGSAAQRKSQAARKGR